jgi:hypothetical protein
VFFAKKSEIFMEVGNVTESFRLRRQDGGARGTVQKRKALLKEKCFIAG